jgi:hypothetical protein
MIRSIKSKNTFLCIRASGLITACAGVFLSGGCGLLGDIVKEHEEICHAQARTIVHDKILWNEYVEGANRNFLNRKREFPDTGRSVIEYVPGFEFRYGANLKERRTPVVDGILRDDVYIMMNGKVVAQLVDFLASYKTLGTASHLNCIGLFSNLYSLEAISDE